MPDQINPPQINIRFAVSRSPNFIIARMTAATHPTFTETPIDDKQMIFEVSPGADEIDYIYRLLNLISGWKSTQILLDNKVVNAGWFYSAIICQSEAASCDFSTVYCDHCIRYKMALKDVHD